MYLWTHTVENPKQLSNLYLCVDLYSQSIPGCMFMDRAVCSLTNTTAVCEAWARLDHKVQFQISSLGFNVIRFSFSLVLKPGENVYT